MDTPQRTVKQRKDHPPVVCAPILPERAEPGRRMPNSWKVFPQLRSHFIPFTFLPCTVRSMGPAPKPLMVLASLRVMLHRRGSIVQGRSGHEGIYGVFIARVRTTGGFFLFCIGQEVRPRSTEGPSLDAGEIWLLHPCRNCGSIRVKTLSFLATIKTKTLV